MAQDPRQQTEPGQQAPPQTSQAETKEQLSDEQLDQVAGGSDYVSPQTVD